MMRLEFIGQPPTIPFTLDWSPVWVAVAFSAVLAAVVTTAVAAARSRTERRRQRHERERRVPAREDEAPPKAA